MTSHDKARQWRWVCWGVFVALAALLAMLWLRPSSPLRGPAWEPPLAQAPQLDDFQQAMLQPGTANVTAPDEVLRRPLFTPGRRPAPVASASAVDAANAPDPMANVRATGVLVSRTLTAVMVEVEGQQKLVRRGDRIGDWQLAAIRGREAVFVRNGARHVVALPYAHTPVPAAARSESVAAKPAAVPEGSTR